MPSTSAPETATGENAPAWAPLITIIPVMSGLMVWRKAKFIPMGTRIATAAGVKVPSEVSTPARRKSTQGIRAVRPLTRRTPAATSRSTVPLRRATANR